jgi:benzoyl-CoA reductase/2-hydroxyglutaryl-CoA dehydratase subunit BcrC/BadD/HgdB
MGRQVSKNCGPTGSFDTMTTNATERERPLAFISWPSVPIEIVRAAGLRPIFVRGGAMATPAADGQLEHEIFPSRLRRLVDEALTGRLSGAACVIIPRTSDPDYKAFLYLREFVRRGIVRTLPPTILFDLLQSDGPDVRAYDAARTRALLDELASVTHRQPSLDDVRHEIARTNAARAAARRLMELRRDRPRVSGAEVFPLLGAFWQLDPDAYVALASKAAGEIAQRPQLDGPRVLLAGAPMDSPVLHTEIESHGAIVVTEAGPWGSGAAGDDVAIEGDPLMALADKYRRDAIGPRTPVRELRASLLRMLDGVDAVVVSLPVEDTAFGWDYPALRDLLQERRIPQICLCGDPCQPLTSADHDRLRTLAAATAPTGEVRHA